MFGNNERLLRKLVERGRSAQADVLEAHRTAVSVGKGPAGYAANTDSVWKLKLLVKPEDAPEFTAEVKQILPGDPSATRSLTVYYDPDDHSRVAIDVSAGFHAGSSSMKEAIEASIPKRASPFNQIWEDAVGDPAKIAADFQSNPEAAMKAIMERTRAAAEAAQAAAGAAGQEASAAWQIPPGMFMPGSTPTPAADPVDQLSKLADLRDRGVLTDQEFQEQKRRILGGSA